MGVRCVFDKVMRRVTAMMTVGRSGRGVSFALEYSFISRLNVSRDITRGNIYLAMIRVGSNACAIATVGRALSHDGLKLLGMNSGIGIRHSVIVGNHLSNRVMRKRISRATGYVGVGSTSNSACFAFRCRLGGRVTHGNCFAMSGNDMAIGNISLAIYRPASGAFAMTVVPCAQRGAGFYGVRMKAIIGVRFSVLNGCVTELGDFRWRGPTRVSLFTRGVGAFIRFFFGVFKWGAGG